MRGNYHYIVSLSPYQPTGCGNQCVLASIFTTCRIFFCLRISKSGRHFLGNCLNFFVDSLLKRTPLSPPNIFFTLHQRIPPSPRVQQSEAVLTRPEGGGNEGREEEGWKLIIGRRSTKWERRGRKVVSLSFCNLELENKNSKSLSKPFPWFLYQKLKKNSRDPMK